MANDPIDLNSDQGQGSADKKAELDTSKFGGNVPKSLQKVELDLDDALFLEDEPESQPKPSSASEAETQPSVKQTPDDGETKDETQQPWWKRRIVLLAVGGGVLLLLVVAVMSMWFLLSMDSPQPTPEFKSVDSQNQTEVAPEPEIVSFDPFWVEYSTNGTYEFLTFSFSVPLVSEHNLLGWEITHKKMVLRDAVYYYLRNKDLVFLRNAENADNLKKDLLAVMNQYLGNGQLEELLIEEYVVR
ncbi:MAG: flagellar basal body-associated FliL family protein [Deltaproteobacteria bacterium]|nr:flagellar basal body-associated FliL family protein [Deltaproteobacteria bacterium]